MSYIMSNTDYENLHAALADANAAVEQYRSTIEKMTQERQSQQATIVRLSGQLAAAQRTVDPRANVAAAQKDARIEDLERELAAAQTIAQREHQKQVQLTHTLENSKFKHNREVNVLKEQMQRREEDHAELVREVHLLRGQIRQDNTTIEQLRRDRVAEADIAALREDAQYHRDRAARLSAVVDRMTNELNDLTSEVAKLKRDLQDANAALVDASHNATVWKGAAEVLETKIHEMTKEHEEEIARLRAQAGAAAANFVTPGQAPLQDLLMRKNAEIESLHGIVNRLNLHIAKEREARRQLEDELDKARSVNSDLDAHCSRLCQKHNQLVEENDSLRKQLDAGIRPLEMRIANQRLEIARLTKTCSQGAIADLKRAYNALANRFDALFEEYEGQKATIHGLDLEVKRLRVAARKDLRAYVTTSMGNLPIDSHSMRQLSDEVGRLQSALTRLTADLSAKTAQVARLKQENTALTSMVNRGDKHNPFEF